MKTSWLAILAIGGLASIAFLWTCGICGEKGEGDEEGMLPCKGLVAPQAEVRERAARDLASHRRGMVKALVAAFDSLSKDPSKVYGSPFHLTTQVIGEWRIEEAIPTLVQRLEFRLDKSTFPVGDRYPLSAYYPVAEALARIGGKNVRAGVFERLKKPASNDVRLVSAWILCQTEGEETARFLVELAQKKAADPEEVKNLEALMKLVKGGNAILPEKVAD